MAMNALSDSVLPQSEKNAGTEGLTLDVTGYQLSDRVVSGAVERGDFPVGGRYRATVRQHSRDRAVSEAVSAQPRAGRRAGSTCRRRFQRHSALQGFSLTF